LSVVERVAQSVEHLPFKQEVLGSIPSTLTKLQLVAETAFVRSGWPFRKWRTLVRLPVRLLSKGIRLRPERRTCGFCFLMGKFASKGFGNTPDCVKGLGAVAGSSVEILWRLR
jgi:hypothetical protein